MKKKPRLTLKRTDVTYKALSHKEYLNVSQKISDLKRSCKDLNRLKRRYQKDASVQQAANYIENDIRNLRKQLKNTNPVTVEYALSLKYPKYHQNFVADFYAEEGKNNKVELFKTAKKQLLDQLRETRTKFKTLKFVNRDIPIRTSPLGKVGHLQITDVTHRFANKNEEEKAKRNKFVNMFMGRGKGGVHVRPNTFYNMIVTRNSNEVYQPKQPKTKEHHIGLELEFFAVVSKEELEAELIKRKLEKYVTWNHDGSIKAEKDRYPHELAILVPEANYEPILKNLCGLLKDAHAKVNKSCGMHVHIDMRNRDTKVVFSNLVSAQNILYAMNPKSRLTSKYCRRTKTKQFSTTGNREDRYRGINPEAFQKHGTIEIRIHAGTVSEYKILNWIKLLLAIANKKDEVKRAAKSFKTFVKQFDIDLDLATYIVERIEKFNSPETQDIEEVA